MNAPTKLRKRKLYQVRIHRDGYVFSKQIGHKCRLLPRIAAARVASWLRRSGMTVTIDPMLVNVTPAQARYLAKRYPLSL